MVKYSQNLLFVCTANKLRSPTGERVFAEQGYATRSAGLHETATHVLNQSDVDWADVVFVFEERQLKKLKKKYDVTSKEVHNLYVPDEFERDAPELVELLSVAVGQRL